MTQLLIHCSIQMTTRVICLVSKFNDGIKNHIRRKPGTVAAEKKHLKDKDVFVFSATELFEAQLNSQLFFATQIKSKKRKIPIEESDEEDVEVIKAYRRDRSTATTSTENSQFRSIRPRNVSQAMQFIIRYTGEKTVNTQKRRILKEIHL